MEGQHLLMNSETSQLINLYECAIITPAESIINQDLHLTNAYQCAARKSSVMCNTYSNRQTTQRAAIPCLTSSIGFKITLPEKIKLPERLSVSKNIRGIISETTSVPNCELTPTSVSNTCENTPSSIGSLTPISVSSCSSLGSISFMTLLSRMSETDEETLLADKGYKKMNLIMSTLQGELYKVSEIDGDNHFAIKRTDKTLYNDKTSIDEDGMSFCVDEDIIKEARILKYLTVDNVPIGNHIIKYIDFFETDTDYYLVIEYIESEMNLAQFVQEAHKYIAENKLKLKHYQKTIKHLFFQLVITISWLHDMNCSHMDLFMENIMLKDCDFIDENGTKTINPNISICLGDFGLAEIFGDGSNEFMCSKSNLNMEHGAYYSPQVFKEELFNAQSSDMWQLGMILQDCMTGDVLWHPEDIWDEGMDIYSDSENESDSVPTYNGYNAVKKGKLKAYLAMNNLLKYFTAVSFDVVNKLLNVNEDVRLSAKSVLKHKWFKSYTKNLKIEKKTISQEELLQQNEEMINFPFYRL